ncbi:aurora kinase [Besnoitia besnoiti]|uniref:Aurora kinase n=1 Tax=Besnoitia besnoiti TaxID=94643 RepID=A0A2A9M9A9_BESBE|nr:aurora kinase [Besnoitia besnoiti]PFH34585.1 aurora kinase [Besnoitia besnoiti]
MHLIYHNVSSSRSGSPADGAFTRPVVAEKIAPALHPQGPPPPGSQAPLLRAPFISYFKTASSNQDIGQRSGPSTCLPGAPVNHGMFEVPSAATPSGCGSSPERFVFCARGRGEDQTGAVTQHLKHENGSFAPPRGALSPSHYPGYHRSASPMGVPGSQWNGDRGLSQRPFLSHPSTPLTRTASPDVLRSQIKRNPGHPDDGLLSQSFPPQVNLSPANHSFSLQQSAFPTLNAGAGIWPLTSAASAARAAAAACNMQGYRACMPMVRQQRLGGADVTQFNALESCAYLSANYSRPASPSVPVTGRTEGSYASAENMRVLSRCVSNLARSGAQTAAAGAKPQQSVLAPGTIPFGSFNDQLHQQQGYSRTPSPVVQQPAQQHAPALQPSGRAGFPAADVFRGADGIRAERSSVASSDRSQNNTGVRDTRPPSPSISQTTYAGYQHDNHPLSHPSDRTLRGGPAGVMNTASSVFLDGHGGGAVSHGAQGTGGHSYGGASQLQPPPTICQSEISPTKTALPLSGVTPPGDRVCAGGKASSASSRRPRSAPPPMLRPQRQIPSLVQQVGNDASGRPFSAGDSESQGESGTRARTVYGGPWQLGETAGASVRSASADPNVISGRHGFAPATTGIAGNGSGRCDPLMTEPTNSCCPCGTVPASVNSCSFTSTSRKLSAFPVAVSAAVAAAAGYSSRTQGQTPGVADCHSGMLTKTRLVLTMKQSAGELGVPRPCQPARMCSTKSLGETEKQPHALPKFGSSLTQTREYSDAARANGSPQSRLPAPVPTTPMLPHVNPRNSHPIHGQGPSQRQESTTLGGQQLHEEGMSWQDKLPSLPPKKAAEQKYGDGASKRHEVEHTYDQGMAPIHSNAISNAGSSESTQSSVERRCSSRRLRSSLSNGELCTADTPGVCSTAGSLPGPGAVAADSSTISAYPASPEPDRQMSGSVSFRIRGSSDPVNGEVAADKSALVSSRTRPTPFRAPAKSHPTEIEVQAAVTSGLAQASTDTNENCSDSVQRFETRCHAARDPCDSSSITTDNTSVEEGSDSMTVVRDHPPQPAQGLSVSGGRGDFSLANDVNDDETPQRQVDYRQGSLHSQSDALADSGRSALGGMAGQVQAEYTRERRKDDVGGQVMKDIAPLRNVSGDGQSPSQHETPEHDDIIPLRRFLWEPEKVTWNDQSSFTEKRTKHTSEESLVNCQLDDFELADSRSGGDASLLGRGTYGVVRKLKHKATGEVFAVKSIEKESVVRAGMVSQVEFELLVQKDLLRHRNVLRCFACVEDAEHVHLILEYCSRGDLYTKVRSQTRRRLSEREAFVYFSQLVNGLHYLHGKGVMHRDLKLENLLLDSNNVLKIADLGWCGSVLGKTKNFNFCGTLDYLAPEMVRGGGHDWRVDLWGAGILLYEMLDGKPPFQSTRHLELVQQVLKAEVTIPPHISPDAGDLILQLLRYEPESRIPLHGEHACSLRTFLIYLGFGSLSSAIYCRPSTRKVYVL